MILSDSISFESTNQFSKLFLDYINLKPELASFYNLPPDIESFHQQIEGKNFTQENRIILKKALINQYNDFEISNEVKQSLELISETNTFTITTGHQLSLFTGPLYFIFKIASAIKLAQSLKTHYPSCHFLPVYWMASEDHDFEEINHFNLFGRKHEWVSNQKGPVGLFENKEIKSIIELLPEAKPLFEKAYLEHDNLADATRFIVNELFKSFGLIVIDGNDASLKQIFKPFILNELKENKVFDSVQLSTQRLEKIGYAGQVHPREINLFYIAKGIRERIVFEENKYNVLNTKLTFSETEIKDLANSNPEKFSPNVILRPLFQEVILPNLAYIGGPGELAYWLQLKDMFESQSIAFPILIPRNFGMIVNQTQIQKLQKLGMNLTDLFLDDNDLKKKYLLNKQSLEWNDQEYKTELNLLFDKIKIEASGLDKTLEGFIEAQRNEGFKILDNIAKKTRKTAELKEQEGINQLFNLKSKLFPNGGLQERTDNFLNFINREPLLISELIRLFDPLKFDFNIFVTD